MPGLHLPQQHPRFAFFQVLTMLLCSLSWLLLPVWIQCWATRARDLHSETPVVLSCFVLLCFGQDTERYWLDSLVNLGLQLATANTRGLMGTGGSSKHTEWLVCIFLFSMSCWWGLSKQAHVIRSVRLLAALSYLHRAWKQHSGSASMEVGQVTQTKQLFGGTV